jgi:hypothetical protein
MGKDDLTLITTRAFNILEKIKSLEPHVLEFLKTIIAALGDYKN